MWGFLCFSSSSGELNWHQPPLPASGKTSSSAQKQKKEKKNTFRRVYTKQKFKLHQTNYNMILVLVGETAAVLLSTLALDQD